MKNYGKTTSLVFIIIFAGSGFAAAQSISFQYGSIPFGKTEQDILARGGDAEVERPESPAAQFLAADAILREDPGNAVYRFFDGGLRKTASWGAAYVVLYEGLIDRTDLRLPGEPKVELYFYEDQLLLLHKSARLEGRYDEVFFTLLPALTSRIGSNPVTGDTKFRGFSYELYSKYAFWEREDVSIFVLAREKNVQSKVSNAEYVYIDTALWKRYKEAAQAGKRSSRDMLSDF
jgi:hypothetical protein